MNPFLVSPKDMDPIQGSYVVPIQNLMSSLKVVPLSILVTVAHIRISSLDKGSLARLVGTIRGGY